MTLRVNRLAIVGVGLIGGSFAQALRQAQLVGEVVGCGREPANLQLAQQLGIIDRYSQDPCTAVDGADVVVLAVPVNRIAPLLAQIYPALKPSAIVTDVGSTKAQLLASIRAHMGAMPARFVPGHPIAGTEKSGAGAAFAELFQGRRVILTPEPETDADAVAQIRALWERCGSFVHSMSATQHDEILAATSHLPHLLAFALVDTLASQKAQQEIFTFAAGGFRDFTRIASSHPEMWAEICTANAPALLDALTQLERTLGRLRNALLQPDHEALEQCFTRAKTARERFIQQFHTQQAFTQAIE